MGRNFFGFNIFLCDLLWIMCETDGLLYFFTRVTYSNVAAQKLYGRVVVLEIPTKLTCASSFAIMEAVRLEFHLN